VRELGQGDYDLHLKDDITEMGIEYFPAMTACDWPKACSSQKTVTRMPSGTRRFRTVSPLTLVSFHNLEVAPPRRSPARLGYPDPPGLPRSPWTEASARLLQQEVEEASKELTWDRSAETLEGILRSA
jgi:hypothetical protein